MGAKEECAELGRLHSVSVAKLRAQLETVTVERDRLRNNLAHLIASYRDEEPVQWLQQILDGTY